MASRSLLKLQRVVEELRKEARTLDGELQLPAVLVLIAVHDNPGSAQRDLVTKTGLSDAAVSRNCALLGDLHRKGEPGLKLIEAKIDPMDRRAKRMSLTKHGEALMRTITSILDR